MRPSLLRWLVPSLAAVLPTASHAVDWEHLLMPGPLIEAHADLESDCKNCHMPFDRRSQRDLCLECHESEAADIAAGTGFHGRSPGASSSDCRVCHPDHRGRAFDARASAASHFDHRATDFPLRHAHASLDCGSCHRPGTPARDTGRDCVDCHSKDDAHRGNLGEDCASCHTESAWTDARFDHDGTDFALVGSHAEVSCGACHIDEKFEGTPTACGSCHLVNDAHRGGLGRDCATCHTPEAWKQGRFDHAKTGFPLHSAHARAKCASCHTGPLAAQHLKQTCVSCHAADDIHGGTRGTKCSSCHTPTRWSDSSFDHDRDTGFALVGGHAKVACGLCHVRAPSEQKPATDCVGCHAADDVHRGGQGKDCGRCHRATGWLKQVAFDHDLSDFPLLGLHATAACESCHASSRFQDAPTACVECHADSDFHQKTMGTDCSGCHTPNDWGLWEFEHERDTSFALHGSHAEVGCRGCHDAPVTTARPAMSTRCVSCHALDDAHHGGFGRDCGRCHDETTWRDPVVR